MIALVFGIIHRFNTQPHEGGCLIYGFKNNGCRCFNTQPHEGGCGYCRAGRVLSLGVSTHSRTKAAALRDLVMRDSYMFQHTAARRRLLRQKVKTAYNMLSFNTQPHEGGCIIFYNILSLFF